MKRRSAAIVVSTLLACHVTSVDAQVQPGTWRDLLDSRIRVSYRHTYPEGRAVCDVGTLPTRAALVSPDHSRPIGRTWLPGRNQSHWEPFSGPSLPDTLDVAVVAVWCTPTTRSVLLETEGYYLELDATQLAQISPDGTVSPGLLLQERGGGAAAQLTLREGCSDGSCRQELVNAEQLAGEIRFAVQRQREEERRRLDEANRAADAQASARLRDAAAVRSRTDAISRQQEILNLQRLGATAEQASAILERRVLEGMTPAMVIAALGEPRERIGGGDTAGSPTVWVYPDARITIAGGRVTAVGR